MNESIKQNADVAIDNSKFKAEKALNGKGIKRRRSLKKMIILNNEIIKEKYLKICLTMQIKDSMECEKTE